VRVALCFPGQGSQAPGMAEGLFDVPAAAPLLAAAADAGLDLESALHRADEDSLRATEVAQPALLFVESVLRTLLPPDLDVAGVAGHSVGEYAAAVAAGVLDPSSAMRLVVQRGRAMASMRDGGMAAVIGMDSEPLEVICEEVRSDTGEIVVVANLNAPGQVVISGSLAGLDEAGRRAREAGARRVLPLNVSGAFHSPLMHEAAVGFAALLDAADLHDASPPVVCNVDAEAVTNGDELRERLRRQLESPVRWSDSVLALRALGATMLVEVGPGAVLTGLARRIAPELETHNVRTAAEAAAFAAVTA